jgi:hypothetical protein
MNPLIVFTASLAAILLAYWSFQVYLLHIKRDTFLKSLYESHRDIWRKLGRPRGWLWHPPSSERRNAEVTEYYINWFSNRLPDWVRKCEGLRLIMEEIRLRSRKWIAVGMPSLLFAFGLFFYILVRRESR